MAEADNENEENDLSPVEHFNDGSVSLKDRYTLEEAAQLVTKGAKIIDFRGGENNLIKYCVNFNLYLYYKRRHDRTNKEYFELLGLVPSEKNKGGLEQSVKKTSEEGGNPKS